VSLRFRVNAGTITGSRSVALLYPISCTVFAREVQTNASKRGSAYGHQLRERRMKWVLVWLIFNTVVVAWRLIVTLPQINAEAPVAPRTASLRRY
jgi:hypothetical protein